MNKTLAALIASGAVLSMAACSATRTQRAPGEQVDDAAVLTSVKSALVSDKVTDAGDINVDVNRGVVKLSGFVDNPQQKAQAADVARRVDGVKSVQNDIAVKQGSGGETAGEYIDDSVLTAKVKAALIESPDTKAHQINVETNQGVVQLSGFVDNAAAKTAATDVAKSVNGVKDVKNELSVKSY
jgi:hyperosmotically inducible protein